MLIGLKTDDKDKFVHCILMMDLNLNCVIPFYFHLARLEAFLL